MFRSTYALNQKSRDECLHELGKRCKAARYLLEFFRSLYPSDSLNQAVRTFKFLQKVLGTFQDLCVREKILRGRRAELSGVFYENEGGCSGAHLQPLRNHAFAKNVFKMTRILTAKKLKSLSTDFLALAVPLWLERVNNLNEALGILRRSFWQDAVPKVKNKPGIVSHQVQDFICSCFDNIGCAEKHGGI